MGEDQNLLVAVFGYGFVLFDRFASHAAMNNGILTVTQFHADRLHEPLTGLSAVAGVDIHVFAVETLRTVVGVAIARDWGPAVAADKIFFFSLE